MASPLTSTNLWYVIRELDEVGVAAMVTGSGRAKLRELADMGEEVGKALVGARPEVESVRKEVLRRAHDVRVSRVQARPASRAIHALRDAVKKVRKLVKKGLGDVPDKANGPGKTTWVNVWGYSDKELRPAERLIERATRTLKKYGLDDFVKGDLILDPKQADGFASYLPLDDAFAIDPKRAGGKEERDFYRAVAARIWVEELGDEDWEVWGGRRSSARFEEALADMLSGKRLEKDAMARLRVTVGRGKEWT